MYCGSTSVLFLVLSIHLRHNFFKKKLVIAMRAEPASAREATRKILAEFHVTYIHNVKSCQAFTGCFAIVRSALSPRNDGIFFTHPPILSHEI